MEINTKELFLKLIEYGPTILFIFIIVLYTVLGFIRGRRKSVIFLIYSLISLGIITTLFLVLSNRNIFNYQSVKIVNFFMGEYYLQDALSVNHARDNLVDILIEYFLKNSDRSILDIVLNSSAYVTALAQAVLRLVLAIVLLVIHFVFKIVYFIIYLIFNRNKKYIKKINKKYTNGELNHPYIKHAKQGALIGLMRGVICALGLTIIIATPAYLVTYNSSYINDIGSESENDETIYLSELAKMGNNGIINILNSVKDKNEVPYYLYVTDIIMQGKIVDEEINYNKNVYFYTELVKYRKFIDDSINLILSYDNNNEIIEALKIGDFDTVYNCALSVFDNQDFQSDFSNIIINFDKSTYLIDLAYSVLNGIVTNLDSFVSGNDEICELCKIVFKKGYKSNSIAYEANLDDDVILPYLTVRELINTSDLNSVVEMIFEVINSTNSSSLSDDQVYEFIKEFSVNLQDFSIFQDVNNVNANGVCRRIYAFVCNTFLSSSSYCMETTIFDSKYDNVSWLEETVDLIEIIPSFLNIFQTRFEHISSNANIINIMFSLQDKDIVDDYNKVRDYLLNSNMLEVVLNTGIVKYNIDRELSALFDDFAYPDEIDALETIRVLDHMISKSSNQEAFDYITNNSINENNYETYITYFNSLFDNYLKEYVPKSNLFRSIITSVLESYASEYIYFDDSVFDLDSSLNKVNRINEEECYNFLQGASQLFNIAKPIITNNEDYSNINKLILNGDLTKFIQSSTIIEGSISKMVFESNDFDFVKPIDFEYVSVRNESEIVKFSNACTALQIDFSIITNSNFDELYEKIKNLNENKVNTVFDSDVIYLNVADYINENSDSLLDGIVIPNSSYEKGEYEKYISRDVIKSLITDVLKLVDDDLTIDALLDKFKDNKEILKNAACKDILNATIASKIVNEMSDSISLPAYLISSASEDSLLKFDKSNPWYNEPYNLMSTLEELSRTYDTRELDMLVEKITEDYSKLIETSSLDKNQLVIDSLYDSVIVKYNISNEICKQLSNFGVSDEIIDSDFIALYNSSIQTRIVENSEIVKLITCTKALDIDLNQDSYDITIKDLFETYNNKPKYEYLNESNLARALISVNVKDELSNNDLKSPNKAKEFYNNKYIDVYTQDEIRGITYIAANIKTDLNDITQLDTNEIASLLYDESENLRSYIINQRISDELEANDDIVIPLSEYDTTCEDRMIKGSAIYTLLKAMDELQIYYISDDMFDNVQIDSSRLNVTYDSDIFRCTLGNIVEFTYTPSYSQDDKPISVAIEVFKESAIKMLDSESNNIYIMSKDELKKFVCELNKMGIYNTSSAIYTSDVQNYILYHYSTMMDSEILQIMLSKFIDADALLKMAALSVNMSKKKVECIDLNKFDCVTETVYGLYN